MKTKTNIWQPFDKFNINKIKIMQKFATTAAAVVNVIGMNLVYALCFYLLLFSDVIHLIKFEVFV